LLCNTVVPRGAVSAMHVVNSPRHRAPHQTGRVMKVQKTATKTQIYFQQKRKCKINKTATRISRSATASVSKKN